MAPTLTPAALCRQLKTIDTTLLDELAFLSRLRRTSSPSGAAYCVPGRAWLGARLGVSIRTITRHTSHLVGLGVLRREQRRPVAGRWQTNLYVLVGRAVWLVSKTVRTLRSSPYRGTSKAHKPPSEGEGCPDGGGKVAFQAFIRTLRDRYGGG
jgi:hypothetical protein